MTTRLKNISRLAFAALTLSSLSLAGCERGVETEYDKAVEAQAELEKARKEAAEKISEAEAEAIEMIQDAREEADDTVQRTRQEAAEMVRDAEQNLQKRLDNLSDKPLEPAAVPKEEPEVVIERKVIVETTEPGELQNRDQPSVK